jgi:hypothetical protein
VDPQDVTGSMQRLTEYLQRSGVPVGEPGSSVTLVDTSFKGTVQELLAAAYPDTSFQGRYVFFGASPEDPHPGSKTGYALHLDAAESSGGRPVSVLPDDPELTFAHQDAIGSIEETLHGPLGSPKRVEAGGPVQDPLAAEPDPLRGLNPELVDPAYADAVVRQGVMDVDLLAVKDYAESIGALERQGVDISGELDSGFTRFRDQIRAWISGEPVDPEFERFMDSFVRRADKGLVSSLADAIRQVGLTPEEAREVWLDFDRLRTVEEKEAFVNQFKHTDR